MPGAYTVALAWVLINACTGKIITANCVTDQSVVSNCYFFRKNPELHARILFFLNSNSADLTNA